MILRITVISAIIFLSAFALILPQTKFGADLAAPKEEKVEIQKAAELNYPKPKEIFSEAPQTTARSVAVIDAKTGMSLYEKDPHLKHLPASTTKMMTALVALEYCIPSDVITVNYVQKDGTQMGLEAQDKVTVENLLYGLLMSSGNDAAYALAQNCAPSYEEFILKMNQKAADLEMKNSHFVNPAGFDDDLQYSTAADLAKLGKVVVANPLIAKIVSTKSTVVTDITGNRIYYIENVNKLLGAVNGVEGVKTGQTEGALEILVTKTTRDGNSIIIALLGSQDRINESKTLIEWAFTNYSWN